MNFDRIIAVRNDKTVYRDSGRVIKVFSDDYSRTHILTEALNQTRAEETTRLNIPRLLRVGTVEGKWCIEREYVEGMPLSLLIQKHKENADVYMDLFTDLHASLVCNEATFFTPLHDILVQRIKAADITPGQKEKLLLLLASAPQESTLCHGDFRFSNVIISDEGKAYILDWAHACKGDCAFDAADAYLTFILDGEEETAEKYLDLFCSKASVSKDSVREKLPIVAAAKSVKVTKEKSRQLINMIKI